jgi:hypothetical protein
MSWIDELMDQIAGASGDGSPADAIPSEPATTGDFNPAKDSSGASKFFETFFGGNDPADTSAMGAQGPEYGSAAKDSQRANEAFGLSADDRMPSVAGFASKPQPSLIDGIMAKIGLKKTSDGSIDWSDPSTVTKALQMIMAGGNIAGAIANRGQPQGYKTAAQLKSEILGPLNNWNQQQQASANAFFSKPMQGSNHQMMFASQMPNPIVPGRGYAGGGTVSPLQMVDSPIVPFSDASPSAAAYGRTPTGGGQAQYMQRTRDWSPLSLSESASSGGSPQSAKLSPVVQPTPTLQAVDTYGQAHGPNAYYFMPGINDFGAKSTSDQSTADLLNREGSMNHGQAWTPDAIEMLASGHPLSYWQEQQRLFDAGKFPTSMRLGGRVQGFAHGGALGHVMASTGGQDDVVPANLAGGEYVFDADTVSALGDGNNAAGARKLDAQRENIRAHKRSAPKNKIPPRAKSPEAYLPGGR